MLGDESVGDHEARADVVDDLPAGAGEGVRGHPVRGVGGDGVERDLQIGGRSQSMRHMSPTSAPRRSRNTGSEKVASGA